MARNFFWVVLPYLSVSIFIAGVLYRLFIWVRTPVPLRIVTTPAPKSRIGVFFRLVADAFWFPNLFRGDKALWAMGFSFHLLLWLVLLRHLRYFLYPVPGWVEGIQTTGLYAGYLIPIPVALLLGRHLVTERALYISILGDFFSLLLLLAITLSGVLLGVFFRTYPIDVKAMILGLVYLQPLVLPVHWLFGLHFSLVTILLIYFPFSKLMHSGGLFLSPTRNQRANFEKPFVNPWDFPVAYNPANLFPPEKYREDLRGAQSGVKK